LNHPGQIMENESAERTILAERGISAPSTNQNSREILYKVELRRRLKADTTPADSDCVAITVSSGVNFT